MNSFITNFKFKTSNFLSVNNNGKKYYFKKFEAPDRNLTYLYNELICYELALKSSVKCVKPNLMHKNNIYGIITESYEKKGYKKINGSKILKEYYGYLKENNEVKYNSLNEDKILSKMNNLEDIWYALLYHFKDYDIVVNEKIIKQIMHDLTKVFVFDIITMQIDRHYENWEILESNNKDDAFLAPLHDNELSFNRFTFNDSIKVDSATIKVPTMRKMLMRYLSISSQDFIDEFIKMYKSLTPEILDESIEKCCKENNGIIPYTYKMKILENYEENYNYITDILLEMNLLEVGEKHAR